MFPNSQNHRPPPRKPPLGRRSFEAEDTPPSSSAASVAPANPFNYHENIDQSYPDYAQDDRYPDYSRGKRRTSPHSFISHLDDYHPTLSHHQATLPSSGGTKKQLPVIESGRVLPTATKTQTSQIISNPYIRKVIGEDDVNRRREPDFFQQTLINPDSGPRFHHDRVFPDSQGEEKTGRRKSSTGSLKISPHRHRLGSPSANVLMMHTSNSAYAFNNNPPTNENNGANIRWSPQRKSAQFVGTKRESFSSEDLSSESWSLRRQNILSAAAADNRRRYSAAGGDGHQHSANQHHVRHQHVLGQNASSNTPMASSTSSTTIYSPQHRGHTRHHVSGTAARAEFSTSSSPGSPSQHQQYQRRVYSAASQHRKLSFQRHHTPHAGGGPPKSSHSNNRLERGYSRSFDFGVQTAAGPGPPPNYVDCLHLNQRKSTAAVGQPYQKHANDTETGTTASQFEPQGDYEWKEEQREGDNDSSKIIENVEFPTPFYPPSTTQQNNHSPHHFQPSTGVSSTQNDEYPQQHSQQQQGYHYQPNQPHSNNIGSGSCSSPALELNQSSQQQQYQPSFGFPDHQQQQQHPNLDYSGSYPLAVEKPPDESPAGLPQSRGRRESFRKRANNRQYSRSFDYQQQDFSNGSSSYSPYLHGRPHNQTHNIINIPRPPSNYILEEDSIELLEVAGNNTTTTTRINHDHHNHDQDKIPASTGCEQEEPGEEVGHSRRKTNDHDEFPPRSQALFGFGSNHEIPYHHQLPQAGHRVSEIVLTSTSPTTGPPLSDHKAAIFGSPHRVVPKQEHQQRRLSHHGGVGAAGFRRELPDLATVLNSPSSPSAGGINSAINHRREMYKGMQGQALSRSFDHYPQHHHYPPHSASPNMHNQHHHVFPQQLQQQQQQHQSDNNHHRFSAHRPLPHDNHPQYPTAPYFDEAEEGLRHERTRHSGIPIDRHAMITNSAAAGSLSPRVSAQRPSPMPPDEEGKLVSRLENMRSKALGNGETTCLLCGSEFGLLGPRNYAAMCHDCRKYVCQKQCGFESIDAQKRVVFLCKICSEYREMWKKSGAWFYRAMPKFVLPKPGEEGDDPSPTETGPSSSPSTTTTTTRRPQWIHSTPTHPPNTQNQYALNDGPFSRSAGNETGLGGTESSLRGGAEPPHEGRRLLRAESAGRMAFVVGNSPSQQPYGINPMPVVMGRGEESVHGGAGNNRMTTRGTSWRRQLPRTPDHSSQQQKLRPSDSESELAKRRSPAPQPRWALEHFGGPSFNSDDDGDGEQSRYEAAVEENDEAAGDEADGSYCSSDNNNDNDGNNTRRRRHHHQRECRPPSAEQRKYKLQQQHSSSPNRNDDSNLHSPLRAQTSNASSYASATMTRISVAGRRNRYRSGSDEDDDVSDEGDHQSKPSSSERIYRSGTAANDHLQQRSEDTFGVVDDAADTKSIDSGVVQSDTSQTITPQPHHQHSNRSASPSTDVHYYPDDNSSSAAVAAHQFRRESDNSRRGTSSNQKERDETPPRISAGSSLRSKFHRQLSLNFENEAKAARKKLGKRSESTLDIPSSPEDETNSLGTLNFSLLYDESAQTLTISVISAKGLKAMDHNGYSDPYVKLHLLPGSLKSTKMRTTTKKRTLNPEWNEKLTYHGVTEDDRLKKFIRLTVMDEDKIGSDFLGEYSFELKKLATDTARQFTVYLEKHRPEQERNPHLPNQEPGKIQLKLLYDTKKEALITTIIRCSELRGMDPNGYSDPYVRINLCPSKLKKHKARTKMIKKNCNPLYNESFTFPCPANDLKQKYLEVAVYDKDLAKTDDFIGSVVIGATTMKGESARHWQTVSQNPGKEIVRWHKLKDVELPSMK